MTVLDGFDYSYARPSPQQMADAGIKAAFRYLYDSPKGITDAERRALHAAGVAVGFGYEANRGNHLLGAPQGAIDGADARRLARALGVPVGTPIYFACDLDVTPAQEPTVMAYLHACDDADYPARAYGEFEVIERFGRPGWQTIAWSGGLVSDHAVIYQWAIEQDFHGSAVDFNTIRDINDLGAWWPEGMGPDVPLTDDDVHRIVLGVKAAMIGDETVASALRETHDAVVALAAQVAKIQPGAPVDVAALARQLAAHLALVAK